MYVQGRFFFSFFDNMICQTLDWSEFSNISKLRDVFDRHKLHRQHPLAQMWADRQKKKKKKAKPPWNKRGGGTKKAALPPPKKGGILDVRSSDISFVLVNCIHWGDGLCIIGNI